MADRPEPPGREETTDDALLDGRVRLVQPRRGHRAGTDAVLLAAAGEAREGDRVVDLGAGTGAVGLMVAARCPGLGEVVFVERDRGLAELCRTNVGRNGLESRARVLVADILEHRALETAGLVAGSADLVVTNPPFLEEGTGRRSPEAGRASARELPAGGLDRWIAAAAHVLADKGRLVLVHRADHLGRCLRLLETRFGDLGVWTVHPRAGEPATRIVVSATKGSRAPLRIRAPLVLHGLDGQFTAEAADLHRGR